MNKIKTALAVTAGLILFVGQSSDAQTGPRGARSGGWGVESKYGRMYDPQTVETVKGEVVKIEKVEPLRGMGPGVHLSVKTDSGMIPVHLGPNWYIENQDAQIKSRDRIEVTGSRITFDGKPAIIASEVRKDGEILRLRDESGRPAWAGWSQYPGRSQGMGRGMRQHGTAGGTQGQGMMEQHRQMMSEAKRRGAELQTKLQAMNRAQGQEKVDAMADVISSLVEERERMFSHMQKMHEAMAHQMGQEAAGAGKD